MKVEIISDIACPWCYVNKTRFWRALSEFPFRGHWHRASTGFDQASSGTKDLQRYELVRSNKEE